MMGRRWLLAGLLVPALLGARSPSVSDVESLLRAGNAAFARGAYAEAAALYEKASDRATDPGLPAFDLAAAKYHLARDGNAQALADAELAYRCCLAPNDPRRAQALFGLGNCLLLRAGASLDRVLLRSAIDRFGECLGDSTCDPALAADARFNRQRARLLLLQAPMAPEGSADEGSRGEDKEEPAESPRGLGEKREPGAGAEKRDRRTRPAPASSDAEPPERVAAGATAPGQGNVLPPVSGNPAAPLLGPQEAQEHLDQASRRILDDIRQYHRTRPRPASPQVRDW